MVVPFLAACGSSDSTGGSGGTPLGTPVKLGAATSAFEMPQVAVDVSDRVTVIWNEDDGTHLNLYAARFESGAWGSPTLLETETGGDAFNPQIAVNAAGEAMVAWVQNTGGANNLAANRYVPASGWGGAVDVDIGIGTTGSPRVGLDADGNGFALHNTGSATTPDIFAYRFTALTNTWGGSVVIDNEDVGTQQPGPAGVAFLSNGDALAVWSQMDLSWQNVWGNVYDATGDAWGTAEHLEAIAGGTVQLKLALAADDTATAFWSISGGSVYANRYDSGWGGENPVNNSGNPPRNQVALDADGAGNVMAAWLETVSGVDQLVARRYDKTGAAWGTMATVASDPTNHMSDPDLAADGSGNVFAAWLEKATPDVLYAARYDAGTDTWSTPVPLESADGNVNWPRVVADSNGIATVVWRQETSAGSGIYDLWALRFQ